MMMMMMMIQLVSSPNVKASYLDGVDINAAIKAASDADAVVVFGSAHSGEGHDRTNLTLGGNTDDLITQLGEQIGKKTAVVMTVPGAILTPW